MDIVAYVANHPKVGQTIQGRFVKYFPGGKGSNQAIACKRLGGETAMIARVGNDPFGLSLLEYQANEGIDISGISCLENVETGTAFITVSESSDNSIIVIPGANHNWEANASEGIDIKDGDIVVCQFEIPIHVIESVFVKAKNSNALTILNPAPIMTITETLRTYTDILVVNEHELSDISRILVDPSSDESIFRSIESLAQSGFKTVIVTLGERGARLLHDGNKFRFNARSVTAVDTTGAGDTFIGGLAAGLLSGYSLQKAIEIGNIAASISVTREGAASSIPTISEVAEIFDTNDLS